MTIYNPLLSIAAMICMPMTDIHIHSGDLLAQVGYVLGGTTIETIVCLDSIMILCGGVLTAYVGVTALMKRLSTDGILPHIFIKTNSFGTSYYSVLCFFLLCTSLFLLIFDAKSAHSINNMGAVYSISFLCILLGFTFAAVKLKLNGNITNNNGIINNNNGLLLPTIMNSNNLSSNSNTSALNLNLNTNANNSNWIDIIYTTIESIMLSFEKCSGLTITNGIVSLQMELCCFFSVFIGLIGKK